MRGAERDRLAEKYRDSLPSILSGSGGEEVTMQRRYEFVDLIVALGLFATIVAGGLLFMTANGTLSMSPSRQSSNEQLVGTLDGMHWLQPVLGQAIVGYVLLERRNDKATSAEVTQVNRLTAEYMRWRNSPFGYLDSIKTSAARADADHATRIQAVMGRAIVNFTGRGIRSGVLSSEKQVSDYNSRMIGRTKVTGQRMDAQFLANWQPNLGRAIVAAGQDAVRVLTMMQERLGAAIVQLTTTQITYESMRAANQEQLGGATVVALQTQLQVGRSERGDTSEPPAMTVAAQRAWPEIPTISILIASVMLIWLFMAGLLVAPLLPRARVVEVVKLETTVLVSPKTV